MSSSGGPDGNGRRRSFPTVFALYNLALTVAAPAVRGYLALRRRYRPLLGRFRPAVPPRVERPVWVHACSIGEVNVAAAFIRAFTAQYPGFDVLLTVSTISGRQRAEDLLDGTAAISWFPFDHPRVVERLFDELQPRALFLIETELWPNVLAAAARRSIPVALVNGRISDKHLARYHRLRSLFAPLLRTLAMVAMQNDEYARRIVALGVLPDRAHVTGNLKFDGALREAGDTASLRAEMGIRPDAPVVVFGSTRPGDEALARACWESLRESTPQAVFVLAPRHLTRLEDALSPFAEEAVLRRSDVLAGRASAGERIVALDTMGELAQFYALADVAVIGGSFSKDIQGHNPIEPASLGVPVVFGPCMRNFADAATLLLKEGGAIQVTPQSLAAEIESLLADSDRRRAMGDEARRVVARQAGATARTLELLAPLLEGPAGRSSST